MDRVGGRPWVGVRRAGLGALTLVSLAGCSHYDCIEEACDTGSGEDDTAGQDEPVVGPWQEAEPAASPPGRAHHAMSYDATRDRVVVFGGLGHGADYGVFGDTWEYDGTTWREVQPAASPSPRHGHAMVFDVNRERLVLFGGRSGDVVLGDTWEFDGTTWTEVTPTASPPARHAHGLAHDVERGQTVLYGGWGVESAHLGDTWEYDGTTWAEVGTGPSPGTSRQEHAMTYDAARQRVVLFGERDPYPTPDDRTTWEYDGSNWGGSVQGPMFHSMEQCMVFDDTRHRVVLAGTANMGLVGAVDPFETWEYDGRAWYETFSPVSPSPRVGHASAFAVRADVTVLFGGMDRRGTAEQDVYLADTWTYSGP